jgi:hypothetical protein
VTFAQVQPNEPTKTEIEKAYRSKAGESRLLFPRARWEQWRIKQIRGWALEFKRLHQDRFVGGLTQHYQIVAATNGLCAGYRITDTMIFTQPNPQMKPILVIEPSAVQPCH